jgi:hypothetical protein
MTLKLDGYLMPDSFILRRRLICASLMALGGAALHAQPSPPASEPPANGSTPPDAAPAAEHPPSPASASASGTASVPAAGGYSLPSDLHVKRPDARLGGAAAALSGWWEGGVPLFGFESLVIFEEFKSAGEVVVVLAVKAIRNRPPRWRRFTASVEGPVVRYTAKGEVPTVFRLQDDGSLSGEVDARGQKLAINFRKRPASL